MPVLRRRPLRERRNVQLNVLTSPSKDNNDGHKSTTTAATTIKHKAVRAAAAARRSRLGNNNGQCKLAPGSRAPYVPLQHTDELEEASEKKKKREVEQQQPAARLKKNSAAPAPLSWELNLDVDDDIELKETYSDPFPSQLQHFDGPSNAASTPTFLQDVFTTTHQPAADAYHHQDEEEPNSFSFAYEEPIFYAAGEEDLRSMHEFLPFLYIAFSDGQYTAESLKASYGVEFTHVLKVAHPSMATDDNPGCISSDFDPMTGAQTLTLTIPSPHSHSHHHSRSSSTSSAYGDMLNASPSRRRVKGGRRHARTGISQRMFTLLTEDQLLAARDFLSLALPYYLEARPTTKKTVPSENVAVLVTAPAGGYNNNDGSDNGGGAADIISAIACYLSFASETPVETVLSYVDEEECLGDEWKDAISRDEDGVGFVQQVAAM